MNINGRSKYPIYNTVHSHIKFTHVAGDKMNVNMIHDTLIKQAQINNIERIVTLIYYYWNK